MHGVQEPGYRGGLPSFSDDELDSPRTEGFPLDPGNPYATSHPAATAAAVLPPPPLLAQPPEIQRSGEYTETCNDLRYPMHDPTMHAAMPKSVADSDDETGGVPLLVHTVNFVVCTTLLLRPQLRISTTESEPRQVRVTCAWCGFIMS